MTTGFANNPNLAGRGVLMTGGASGIGACLVEHFARQGARIDSMDRDEAVAALVGRLGDVAQPPVFAHGEITDLDRLAHGIEILRAAVGPLEVPINGAANDARYTLDEVTLDDVDEASVAPNIAVNLRHQVFVTKAVIADMKQLGGSSVICMGSSGWSHKNAGSPRYAVAKAGVRGFVNGTARERGAKTIRLNCLVLGWVITEKQRRLSLDAEASIERMQRLPGDVEPSELVRAALFLAADDSRICAGRYFILDGGRV